MLLVVGLLVAGVVSGIGLTWWRVQTGYILLDFHTESTVAHRVVAQMRDGPAQPASAVWIVRCVNGEVAARDPEHAPEPVRQGAVHAPGGFPEPDPALVAKHAQRPGFVGLQQAVAVEMRAINHDGTTLRVEDPALFAEMVAKAVNNEGLRVSVDAGRVTGIIAATEKGRPGHR